MGWEVLCVFLCGVGLIFFFFMRRSVRKDQMYVIITFLSVCVPYFYFRYCLHIHEWSPLSFYQRISWRIYGTIMMEFHTNASETSVFCVA